MIFLIETRDQDQKKDSINDWYSLTKIANLFLGGVRSLDLDHTILDYHQLRQNLSLDPPSTQDSMEFLT